MLAVVLAGKGVASLQDTGCLEASPILAPSIEPLGIYSSAETVVAQIIVLLIALLGFAMNGYRAHRLQSH